MDRRRSPASADPREAVVTVDDGGERMIDAFKTHYECQQKVKLVSAWQRPRTGAFDPAQTSVVHYDYRITQKLIQFVVTLVIVFVRFD
jgi:hypothetical protein